MSLLVASNSVIINCNNEWIAVLSCNDPTKPFIEIKDIRIASRSDKFDPEKNYVGLIIYLWDGKSEFQHENEHYRTGDIYIKETNWILENTPERKGRDNDSHGRLFHWIFGCWEKVKLNFSGGSFSYLNGKWNFDSRTCNTMNSNNDDGYHSIDRKLNEFEEQLIQNVCNKLYENDQWSRLPEARVSIAWLLDLSPKSYASEKLSGTTPYVFHHTKDPKEPPIVISDIHIASRSDKFNPKKNYVGLIIYLCDGKSNFILNNVECRTGDIYIKESSWILKNTRERRKGRANYHARLFHWIFGSWKTKKLNFVSSGFSYVYGKWVFNSQTLNTMNPDHNDDGYHDKENKELDTFEEQLIQNVCKNLYEIDHWSGLPEDRVSIAWLLDQSPKSYANTKLRGTVKLVNCSQGYGFIECSALKDDIFVHCSEVLNPPIRGRFLIKGDDVEFKLIEGNRGWEAQDVVTIEPINRSLDYDEVRN
jgi:cold shock CspA family protein